MYRITPEYHTIGQSVLVTLCGSGSDMRGYPLPPQTLALGTYPNQAQAEAAWYAWCDAQEGEAKRPWEGVNLPEVPQVDGGVKALIAAALKSADVVLVSSNGSDFFAATEGDAKADVLLNWRNYDLEVQPDEDDWKEGYAAVDYPDHQLVSLIRRASVAERLA